MLLTAAADASVALALRVHFPYVGAPLNALSTSDSVARPLVEPRVAWVSVKIAPRNVPLWVVPFLAVAVTSFNEPRSELTSEPTGIWVAAVKRTNPEPPPAAAPASTSPADVERFAERRLDEHDARHRRGICGLAEDGAGSAAGGGGGGAVAARTGMRHRRRRPRRRTRTTRTTPPDAHRARELLRGAPRAAVERQHVLAAVDGDAERG